MSSPNPTHPNTPPSVLRRALFTAGAMLGATSLFVGALMLTAVSVIDRALPPGEAPTLTNTAETTEKALSASPARVPPKVSRSSPGRS